MNLVEPLSRQNTFFLIGRNNRGQWVAREQNGLYGGLFVNRAAATRYALFENGHHPEAIIFAASPLELDIGATPSRPDQSGVSTAERTLRLVSSRRGFLDGARSRVDCGLDALAR